MSGITVSEDAVNLYYYMKAKSAVRSWCHLANKCCSIVRPAQLNARPLL